MILYIFFFVDGKVILLLNMAIVKICSEPQELLQVFACKEKRKRHYSMEPLSFAFWSGPYESGGQNCQMLVISDGSTQYLGKRRSGKLFLKGHIVNTLGLASWK